MIQHPGHGCLQRFGELRFCLFNQRGKKRKLFIALILVSPAARLAHSKQQCPVNLHWGQRERDIRRGLKISAAHLRQQRKVDLLQTLGSTTPA